MSTHGEILSADGDFGPGHHDHNDHTHVDGRTGRSWAAPNRGV
ncbi:MULTISPECIES: hypothetical protein [unclassified Streptomyces]|nr:MULTISPECIES: hypothetical protein [unclassified Streptomyces]SCG08050.1 zinc D-Ala-D-Ala carboxypeptidase [Streptomyces sp. MnatMP-M17]